MTDNQAELIAKIRGDLNKLEQGRDRPDMFLNGQAQEMRRRNQEDAERFLFGPKSTDTKEN